MSIEKNLNNLVINKVESQDVYNYIDKITCYLKEHEEINFITKAVEDRLKYINVFSYKILLLV